MKTLATFTLALALAACGGKPKAAPGNKGPDDATAKKIPDAGGTAKVVGDRTASGGVIELQGERGKAMDAANKQMADHCGAGSYMIHQEGEEVADGGGTVWRVHYQCTGAAPSP